MGGRGAGRGEAPAAPESMGPAASVVIVLHALDTARNTSSYPYLGEHGRMLADVRDAMARDGIRDRTAQDTALRAALRAGRIDINSAIATYLLTRREIDAGIMLGGTVDHWIEPR